ncbi:TetR family transcriptional regulator [Nocardioides jensenii]|uniref:TetR family transcriptional regulator n=1 Tax=Nocardioides jensenii TaxID=1843 RepID=UPI0008307D5F|nr:TetR family transcriptional regulator [Nocardioides jensenii]
MSSEEKAVTASRPENRQERKERTRRAILDAALEMLAEESFGTLSLRSLTKQVGIVPTAFYRHFATLDELGLSLVDESFMTLRDLIREVRSGEPAPETLIDHSVEVLVAQLETHKAHFRFIGRERHGGNAVLRDAIRHELGMFERELATDLARMPGLERWGAADLHVLASLFVDLMVAAAGELVSPSAEQPPVRRQLVDNLRNQARMIVVGAAGWKPLEP